MVHFLAPPAPAHPSVRPDADQAAVLAHRGPVLRVIGGPGTGKTFVAVQRVVTEVASGRLRPEQCLLIAPTRRAAARVRDQVSAAVAGTSSGPLARTPHSLAFGVLRRRAALRGEEVPRLISGPEQDVILRELLSGYAAEPAFAPTWPPSLVEAVPTRTFRGELRDLLLRAVELGLEAEGLRALGLAHDRPEWAAAAAVLADYDAVTALAAPGSLDPAWLLGAAAARLADEPDLLAQVRHGLRLVVVDDAHELTPAATQLLHVLTSTGGPDVVLLGDPDAATQTFRGAEPALMLTGWPQAQVLRLGHGHRLPERLRKVAERVSGHIGSVGEVGQRRFSAVGGGRVDVEVLRTPAQEAAWIADRLRRRHLLSGIPWSDMAVIVRGGATMVTLERALRRAGVPVGAASARPVRDHPAVRPLLTAAAAVLRGDGPELTDDEASDLITSPLGGGDALSLRRLRRALRRQEVAAGGARPGAELVAWALGAPAHLAALGPEAAPARRVARVLAAGHEAAETPGATIETLLWALWQASGLAPVWQRTALIGGPSGIRADGDLDAVLTLFDTAARYVERMPGQAPSGFLDHLLAQDVAADTLARHAPDPESVALLTPAEAAGRQWRVVCVAGVQEGSWPDPRLRGVLLGAADLVDAARGRLGDHRAARAAVIHDETRLFLVAVTRASEDLAVTAVRSEEAQPSAYLDIVDPRPERTEPRPLTDPPRPLSFAGLVAQLRRALVEPGAGRRGAAATGLAHLADAGVAGADPAQWWPLTGLTGTGPRRAPDQVVRVSPSRLDRFVKCPLQWFFTTSGGEGPRRGASEVGILVHDVAHALGDTSAAAYADAVRARWPRLGLGDTWLSRANLDLALTMTRRLAAYVEEAGAQGWAPIGTELDIDVTVGRARIRGRVDRVETDATGRLRIVDLKTGSSKPTATEVARHLQLGAYQVAVEGGALGGERRSAGAGLLQLGKAAKTTTTLQVQPPLAADSEPDWAVRALADNAEAMGAASFAAQRGGGLCGTCQVRSSCPAQAEGRRLW